MRQWEFLLYVCILVLGIALIFITLPKKRDEESQGEESQDTIMQIKSWWRKVLGKETQEEIAQKRGLKKCTIKEWGCALQQACPYCDKCQTRQNDSLYVSMQLSIGPITYKILTCEKCDAEFLGLDPDPVELNSVRSGKSGWT